MKILQLCVFTNLWSPDHQVTSYDLKNNKDIFDIIPGQTDKYDLIISAPPCDQFTKANAPNWIDYPGQFISIANHCFEIQTKSGTNWLLENPPGRIEKFIPGLTKYRLLTWKDYTTNKEYILYGNIMVMQNIVKRYGKEAIKRNKTTREMWRPDLIKDIEKSIL